MTETAEQLGYGRSPMKEFILEPNDGRDVLMQDCDAKAQLEMLVREAEESFTDPSGIFVEVGVFLGHSASIIAEAKDPERELYLFDTWSGMPKKSEEDRAYDTTAYIRSCQLFEGDLSVPMEEAIENLSKYKNIIFTKGVFPQDTNDIISGKKIHLAHLDIDFYKGTLDSLFYVFYYLVPGGKIIVHDACTPTTPGVGASLGYFISIFKNECTHRNGSFGTVVITKNRENA